MSTQEIPRDEWKAFFNSFSQSHQGRLVTVEVLGPDLGDQVEARELPLEGITAELKREGEVEIEIVVGRSPDSHISHTVTSPKRVWVKRTEEGACEVLEIEAYEQAILLRFGAAARPEDDVIH